MREFYAEANYPLPTEAAAQAFQRLLDQPELGSIWLMEHDGEPAGYAVLTVGYSMEFGGLRGFVDDLFVKAACRRLGLAKEALAEIRRECTNRGVRALLVETGHDNDAARPLYAGFGFEDSGRLLLTLALAAPVHEE
jgi:GNAT superfamily N-acetyltransferase